MSADNEGGHVSHEGGHVIPEGAHGSRMILGIVLNPIIFYEQVMRVFIILGTMNNGINNLCVNRS